MVCEGASWVVPSWGQEAQRWSRGSRCLAGIPASRPSSVLGAPGLRPLCGRRPGPWVLSPPGTSVSRLGVGSTCPSCRRRGLGRHGGGSRLRSWCDCCCCPPSSGLSYPWRQRWTCGSSCVLAPTSGATWTSEACPGEPCWRPKPVPEQVGAESFAWFPGCTFSSCLPPVPCFMT